MPHKNKKKNIYIYQKIYSKENKKQIMGARKGCWNAKK